MQPSPVYIDFTIDLCYAPLSGVSSAADCMWTTNLIKVYLNSKKNWIFSFSLPVSSQLILKYTYALDVLILHIVHMTYFDYTLSVLQIYVKELVGQAWSIYMTKYPTF